MKKILFFIILVLLVLAAMCTSAFVFGELIGYDSIGVKGLTAGVGLYIIYNRSTIFGLLNKKFKI